MDARSARVARALTAAVVSTSIAGLSHVAGGGEAPGPATVALALAAASLLCTALSVRRLSLWRLAASVAVSQAAFHGIFSITGGSALSSAHSHETVAVAISSPAMEMTHSSTGMWLAHLAAAVMTVAALAHGERLLVALLGLAGVRLWSSEPLVALLVVGRPVVRWVLPLLLDRAALGVLRHRGPPVAV